MRFRPILPIATIALAGGAALFLYNLGAPEPAPSALKGVQHPTVSGRVVTSLGTPPREMTVWATRPTVKGSASTGVPVREDGSFTNLTLEPGKYVLSTGRAGDPTASATPIEGGFTIVDVGEGDGPNVTIRTTPTVSVRARIRYERADPQAVTPNVVLHARLHVEGFERGHGIIAFGQPDGSVVLYDLYGPRVIDYGWSQRDGSDWEPKAVLLNGEDITGTPVDFTGVRNPQLEVVFAQRKATGKPEPREPEP